MKKQVFNPFLPLNEYIPDGEPHVFGGRVYLFGSHDKEGGNTFCMLDYTFWSAPVNDLSDWSCPGTSYSARQDPLYDPEKLPYMFAPDAVRGNDGRFYLYYCMAGYKGKGGYSNPVSVAVCDTPDGKYEYLGFVRSQDGSPLMRYVCFDPAVINDNGIIRLYYGTWFPFDEYTNFLNRGIFTRIASNMFGRTPREIRAAKDGILGAIHVTLGDDMLTAASGPVRILPYKVKGTGFAGHPFFEGSSVRKVGETYYFVYSSTHNHELCYAVSKYPDRDFRYGGVLVSNGDVGYSGRLPKDRLNATGTNHGGIECINGQWYVFYHRLTHRSDFSRQACAEPVAIASDGSITMAEMTSCGLNGGPLKGAGAYPAPIACNLTNGKMPHGMKLRDKKKIPCVSSAKGEQFIRDITNGTWIGFKYFDFSGIKTVTITVRGNGSGCFMVSDSLNGKIFAYVPVLGSDHWKEYSASVSLPDGVRPLFFQFDGTGSVEMLDFSIN
jgi:hypothetical protein